MSARGLSPAIPHVGFRCGTFRSVIPRARLRARTPGGRSLRDRQNEAHAKPKRSRIDGNRVYQCEDSRQERTGYSKSTIRTDPIFGWAGSA